MPETSVVDLLPNPDYNKVSMRIQEFISEKVRREGASGVVVGLSGGIDSSVVLDLASKALTPHRVLGILMPRRNITPARDVRDAELLASDLGVEYRVIEIDSIISSFMEHLVTPDVLSQGNLTARVRMSILYYHANLMGKLVAGTGDKSELLIGSFTKFGDGGVDMLPIGDLYKTQVRSLGRWLDLPPGLVEKKSSPQLWASHDAQDELGVSYETIDQILYGVTSKAARPEELSTDLGINIDLVRRILDMSKKSRHKRSMPETCKIS
jgi:NAD+ synthase